ncbi:Protein of unknown function [Gryllus bimaculatus]|nr:Protein of unknown function [Gryllus bimaculatus]
MGETVVMARRRVKGKTKDGGSWVLVARGQSAVGGGAVAITVVVGVAVAIMAVAVGGAEVENWARRIAQGSQQKGSRGATPRTGRGWSQPQETQGNRKNQGGKRNKTPFYWMAVYVGKLSRTQITRESGLRVDVIGYYCRSPRGNACPLAPHSHATRMRLACYSPAKSTRRMLTCGKASALARRPVTYTCTTFSGFKDPACEELEVRRGETEPEGLGELLSVNMWPRRRFRRIATKLSNVYK